MGFYVEIINCDITILKDQHEAAYKEACALNWRNDLKRGGKWPCPDPLPEGPNEYRWFAWVDWNYHETCKNLVEAIEMFGFEVELDEEGNIVGLGYDTKTGNEDVLFNAIACFVVDGSFIDWRGEDNSHWRWVFKDGRLEEWGHITYH